MFACLRISRAPLTQAFAVRALSTSAPRFSAGDEPADAIRSLADLVQSAAEEQGKQPTSLSQAPSSKNPDKYSQTSPHQFTREHRIARTERRRKDPTLGPSRKHAQAIDAFRKLDIDPLDEFKNPLLLKAFVSEMGKIHSRAKTGLTWRSQRRVGKAIRRARALGLIPLWNSPVLYDNSSARPLPDWTRPARTRLR